MSGIVGGAGSRSGVIGVAKHEVASQSWHIFPLGTVTISSAVLDFDGVRHMGNRITESGGRITVLDAGLYWIGCRISKDNNSGVDLSIKLRIDGTEIEGTRMYTEFGTGEPYYLGQQGSWTVPLNAGQIIDMYGSCRSYGGGSTNSMTWFSGARIGA